MANCVVCGKKRFKKLFVKDMLDAKYAFVQCSCGLKFINPQPASLDEYYNDEYSVPLYQEKKVRKKAQKVFRFLKKFGVTKGKILDVGASHGFFLNLAKKKFKVFGIEIDKRARRVAKKRFGIGLDGNFLSESKLKEENAYDAAVMLDVLEHVPNPDTVIKDVYYSLKKDGVFILTLPNGDATEIDWYGKFWEWASPPAHLFYFTPKSLRKLLEKAGFTVEHVETYRGDSAGNLLFHGYLALRQAVFYQLKHVFGKEKMLEMRNSVRKQIDASAAKQKSEFTGSSGVIKSITEFLYPSSFDKKRFKKGKGPSIFIVGRK